jgi:hypothetical protein
MTLVIAPFWRILMLRRWLAFNGLAFACASTLSTANAQVPSISSVTPQAVAPGASTDIVVKGANLANIAKLWTSFAAESALAPDVKDNGKNAATTTWRINVPKDTPVGIHAVRVAGPGGVSALKLIMVDDLKSVPQTAGNTTREKAQAITLPVAIDGAVPNLNFSFFKFNVTAGQKVSLEVVARRLGSGLDPIVRILDSAGQQIAWSDDVAGLRSDSRVCHTFAKAGEYLIELRDIRYTGGAFRLRVGDFPCITAPIPTGVTQGQTAKVSFAGVDAADVGAIEVTGVGSLGIPWTNVSTKRPGGASSGFAMIKISDRAEASEVEPNDELAKATRVQPNTNLSGRIDKVGDVDHFIFAAKKGEKLTFTALTRRLGSPTSSYVRLLTAAGAQVAAKEDFGIGDATFDYNIPADGDFVLAIADLHGRGGPEFAYRIEVKPNLPSFKLSASVNTLNVGAGSTAMITVTSARKGYNGPIQVSVEGLPEGFVSEPTVLGPGINTVVLTISNRSDKAKAQPNSVRIIGTASVGGKEIKAFAHTEAPLKASMANIPWVPEGLSGQVSFGVAAQPQIRLRTEPSIAVFGKSLSGKIKVIVERAKGFDEAITLVVTPDAKKGGLPGNITVALKPIPKGKNEIEITFSATDKAALGDFTAVLNATIKQGKTTVTQPVPGVTLRLQAPLKVTATGTVNKIAAGGQLKVKVVVERNPALKGEVVLTFAKLPKGVTAPATKIAADKSEIEVTLAVAADAAKGTVANVTVKGEVTVGKVKLSGTSGNVALTVE